MKNVKVSEFVFRHEDEMLGLQSALPK